MDISMELSNTWLLFIVCKSNILRQERVKKQNGSVIGYEWTINTKWTRKDLLGAYGRLDTKIKYIICKKITFCSNHNVVKVFNV